MNGNFVKHLITVGGVLNAPWAMVLAPSDFGTLSGTLLIGNFGDGAINAFDPATGAQVGAIKDAAGTAFAVPGLWGMAFGNDTNNQPHNTLFFAAGTNDEANGLYGRIDLGATPPVLNAPPVVAVTAPTGNLSGTVTLSATVQAHIGIAKVDFLANGTPIGTVTTAPYTVDWDTTSVADGSVSLTAVATDVDGNVGTSPAISVTVANTAPAVTLTQLQTEIFTPICSGCHNGSNAPGGATARIAEPDERGTKLREPRQRREPRATGTDAGEARRLANSYLVMKLEGTAGISGSRMPLGGPFLDQATIDKVKAWIASGAPNN